MNCASQVWRVESIGRLDHAHPRPLPTKPFTMLRSFLLSSCFAIGMASFAQLESIKYTADPQPLPAWAQLMYAPSPDPGAVEAAFNAYYATHAFMKNSHTQYFKRWKRELGHRLEPLDPAQRASYGQDLRGYLDRTNALSSSRASNWSCIGPTDWDHGAVAKSYACGAAHVYTVEQSASNTNLVYAGTANSGVWKSTDKGFNWTNMTKLMMVGQVYSVEIDWSNENNVWFGAEGDLWKSTDGGSNWSTIGDATFQGLTHSIRDIVLHPSNNQKLFVCSDQGLYRSDNGGTSFTQVQAGIWQELEFKPGDPNTIYAIKQVSNRTEFWRSINAGTSFTQGDRGFRRRAQHRVRPLHRRSKRWQRSVRCVCEHRSGRQLDLPVLRHRSRWCALTHQLQPDGLGRWRPGRWWPVLL